MSRLVGFHGFLIGLALVLSALAWPANAQVKIEGVTFDKQLSGNPPLELQGYGLLRYRLIIKAYVAAYYQSQLDAPLTDPLTSRKLIIEYFHAIKAEDFARVTLEGVQQNTTAEVFTAIEDDLEAFLQSYQAVQPGDRYTLSWHPEQGLSLSLNQTQLINFDNAKLSQALFAIWLGDQPGDRRLKERLLGRG